VYAASALVPRTSAAADSFSAVVDMARLALASLDLGALYTRVIGVATRNAPGVNAGWFRDFL